MLRRPSNGRPLKNILNGICLSVRYMRPSKLCHALASAFRTDCDIIIPDCFQKFCHRHTCIKLPELLMSLKFEDRFQILFFHAIVQKSVVSDLLETGWEYMHEKPADEFCMFQYYIFHCTGFIVPGRKSNRCLCYFFDTAVSDGNTVCIATEIFDRISKAIESFFDIWTPLFFIEPVFELLPFIVVF